MPNNYKSMSPEAKKHWVEYNRRYSKENYKTYNIKLNVKKDADVIDFIENSGETFSSIIKKAVKEYVENHKK